MKKKITLIILMIIVLVLVGIIAVSTYTSSEVSRKKKAGDVTNTEQMESSTSPEQLVQTDELTDTEESDSSSETEECECADDELPRLVMINDELYYDTGEEGPEKRSCGNMDGTIQTSQSGSKGIPTENDSSNFGIGYGWQYDTEDTIQVDINGEWCVFRKYEKGLIEPLDHALDEKLANDLGLTVKTKDVTNAGLTLVFTQSGGNPSGDLETGSDFIIEINNNGYWEEMPLIISEDELTWTDEAYEIAKGGMLEMDINWVNLYGELKVGNYRIRKNVMDFKGPEDYDTYEVHAEFVVE